MYPHRIRLRGPWDWQAGDERGRIVMPADLPSRPPIRLRRRFGWSAPLRANEHLWIVCSGMAATGNATLNKQHIATSLPFEHDITLMVQPRNQLQLDIASMSLGVAEVYLEVRASAWLRNVRLEDIGTGYHVRGDVAGSCDRPLDLYVLVEGKTAGYGSVQAGQSFTLPIETSNGRAVRVELVNGGVVWYVVEP